MQNFPKSAFFFFFESQLFNLFICFNSVIFLIYARFPTTKIPKIITFRQHKYSYTQKKNHPYSKNSYANIQNNPVKTSYCYINYKCKNKTHLKIFESDKNPNKIQLALKTHTPMYLYWRLKDII